VRFSPRHISTTQGHNVRNAGPQIEPASDYPAWDRKKSQRSINLIGPGEFDRVPARQKDVASHLDNTRLMWAFPQSPKPHDGNAIFNDGPVKRHDPGSKNDYMVPSLGEGSRYLLASGRRSSADRRVLVVNEQKSHAKTQSLSARKPQPKQKNLTQRRKGSEEGGERIANISTIGYPGERMANPICNLLSRTSLGWRHPRVSPIF